MPKKKSTKKISRKTTKKTTKKSAPKKIECKSCMDNTTSVMFFLLAVAFLIVVAMMVKAQ